MPQSPLVGPGCLLCSLAGWYHWLHSVIGQGYELGPTIPPDQVGYQAVFPNQMVLQMQVGPQAGHCGRTGPQVVLCNQVRLQAVS